MLIKIDISINGPITYNRKLCGPNNSNLVTRKIEIVKHVTMLCNTNTSQHKRQTVQITSREHILEISQCNFCIWPQVVNNVIACQSGCMDILSFQPCGLRIWTHLDGYTGKSLLPRHSTMCIDKEKGT